MIRPNFEPALRLRSLVVGPLQNNVYFAVCPRLERAVLIDPAGDAARVREIAAGLRVEAILLTHGHPDHTGAGPTLAAAFGVPLRLHPADADLSGLTGTIPLEDDEEIAVGSRRLRVLATPGHTPGSVCFYGDGCLFSGDTLFPGGPGATADPSAFGTVMISLRARIFTLPDATTVLPGHGPATTIGAERPHLDEWQQRGW